MAWAKNGTDTLTGASTTSEIIGLTGYKFNNFMYHRVGLSGTMTTIFRCNDDSNSVYSLREEQNGGSDGTAVSQTSVYGTGGGNNATDEFVIGFVCSISGEEKLAIVFTDQVNVAGSGTAPTRRIMMWKFVPSPDADITEFNHLTNDADTFGTGTNISALGTD